MAKVSKQGVGKLKNKKDLIFYYFQSISIVLTGAVMFSVNVKQVPQQTFTCSKLTIETLGKDQKYVQI